MCTTTLGFYIGAGVHTRVPVTSKQPLSNVVTSPAQQYFLMGTRMGVWSAAYVKVRDEELAGSLLPKPRRARGMAPS